MLYLNLKPGKCKTHLAAFELDPWLLMTLLNSDCNFISLSILSFLLLLQRVVVTHAWLWCTKIDSLFKLKDLN